LFAGVSLDGAVFKEDKDGNQDLYGHRVTAKQILIEGVVGVPPAAMPLRRELAKYSPKGGHSLASL
jgi:lipid-binding SYLF domain-containing protein